MRDDLNIANGRPAGEKPDQSRPRRACRAVPKEPASAAVGRQPPSREREAAATAAADWPWRTAPCSRPRQSSRRPRAACRSRQRRSCRNRGLGAGVEAASRSAARPGRGTEVGKDGLVHPQGAEQPRGVDPRRAVAAGGHRRAGLLLRRGDRAHREGHGVQGRQEAGHQAEALSGLPGRPHGDQRRHVVPGPRDAGHRRFHRRRRASQPDAARTRSTGSSPSRRRRAKRPPS